MTRLSRRYASIGLLSLVAAAPFGVHAETPAPMAGKPEDVGLSSAQLQRIEAVTRQNIEQGLMPGAAMLVVRRGKVAWVSVQGKRAPDSDDAMKIDTIFRIYSMTKPIVSLALMQLVEEGKLQVSDPVAKFLPEMGSMKVGTEVVGADGRTTLHLADPDRPMTVQDLLRHTAGLTYAFRGNSLVHQAYREAKIGDRTASNEEMVQRLGKLPLLFSPGARWEYSVSVDVQGRLIEVLTGKKLGEALSERVFQPLGMVDTAFKLPAEKVARVAQPGQKPNGPPMTARFKVDDGARYESGGGGLLGSTEDYLRFTLALANRGAFQGKRIIGRKTLEFMTADHVVNRPGRPDGFGFGLGFEVHTRLGDSSTAGSVGEYGWSGAAGTTFWVDPKEQLVGLYMVQASDGDTRFLRTQFRTMVQAALVD